MTKSLVKNLKKNGDSIHPVCPKCGACLLHYDVMIDKEPSMKIIACFPQKEKVNRLLWLSVIWGDFHNVIDGVDEKSRHAIKEGEVMAPRCPYCYEKLTIEEKCSECDTQMFELFEANEHEIIGIIHICNKSGCHNHEAFKIPEDFKPKYKHANFISNKDVKKFAPTK